MILSNKITTLLIFGFLFAYQSSKAQVIDTTIVNYREPKKYKIAALEISGTQYLDKNIIRSLTGLKMDENISIPGDEITKCIKNLWKQGLFGNVSVYADKLEGDKVYLTVDVQERPRLSAITLRGLKKNDADDIKKKLESLKGKPLTDALKQNIRNIIIDKFEEKSYLHSVVTIVEKKMKA